MCVLLSLLFVVFPLQAMLTQFTKIAYKEALVRNVATFYKPGINRFHGDKEAIKLSQLLDKQALNVPDIMKKIELTDPYNYYGLMMDCIYNAHLHKQHEASYNNLFMHLLKQGKKIDINQPLARWGYEEYDDRASYDQDLPALHCASKYDLAIFVRSLLAHKADVHKKDVRDQKSALHYAQSRQVVEQLVESGANSNQLDRFGNTPLHICPARVVPTLIKHKADPTIKTNGLILFSTNPDYLREIKITFGEVVAIIKTLSFDERKRLLIRRSNRWLEDRPPFETRYYDYDYDATPLMYAIHTRDLEKVKTLIAHTPPELLKDDVRLLKCITWIYKITLKDPVYDNIMSLLPI